MQKVPRLEKKIVYNTNSPFISECVLQSADQSWRFPQQHGVNVCSLSCWKGYVDERILRGSANVWVELLL